MNDHLDPIEAPSPVTSGNGPNAEQSDRQRLLDRLEELARRLEALENAKRPSPHVDLSTVQGSERFERLVEILQEAVHNLAADNRGLHEKLSFLASVLIAKDQAGAPVRSTGPGSVATGDPEALALRVLALEGEVERLRRLPHYRAATLVRRIVSAGSRVVRFAGQRALRLVRSARDRRAQRRLGIQPGAPAIVIGSRSVLDFPALAVVVPADDYSEEQLEAVTRRLAEQTTRNWECLQWHASTGAYRVLSSSGSCVADGRATDADALREAIAAPYVCTLPQSHAVLPSTWLEIGLWALAGEPLAFVSLEGEPESELRAAGSAVSTGGNAAPKRLIIAEKTLWSLTDSLDTAVLQRVKSEGRWVMGKRLHLGGAPNGSATTHDDWASRLGLSPVAGREGYMAAGIVSTKGLKRTVYNVNEVLQELVVPDTRATVLVAISPGLRGERERLPSVLLSALASRFRFVVVTVGESRAPKGKALEALRRVTPLVYPLAEQLPEHLHRSLFHQLVRKYDAEAVLILDGCAWLASAPWLRGDFAGLRIVLWLSGPDQGDQFSRLGGLMTGVDELVVSNRRVATRLIQRNEVPAGKMRYVGLGVDLARVLGAADRARTAGLRSELGIPENGILVTMDASLAPAQRPEDFVALAGLLRTESEFHFLLVGDGELAAAVSRLADSFGLDNFHLRDPVGSREELLATTDIVCLTAEDDSSLSFVLDGLAMGTPVVATAVSCIEVMEHDRGCGMFIASAGDLKAFREALVNLRPEAVRRELGARGRSVAESFFAIEQRAESIAAALTPDWVAQP